MVQPLHKAALHARVEEAVERTAQAHRHRRRRRYAAAPALAPAPAPVPAPAPAPAEASEGGDAGGAEEKVKRLAKLSVYRQEKKSADGELIQDKGWKAIGKGQAAHPPPLTPTPPTSQPPP